MAIQLSQHEYLNLDQLALRQQRTYGLVFWDHINNRPRDDFFLSSYPGYHPQDPRNAEYRYDYYMFPILREIAAPGGWEQNGWNREEQRHSITRENARQLIQQHLLDSTQGYMAIYLHTTAMMLAGYGYNQDDNIRGAGFYALQTQVRPAKILISLIGFISVMQRLPAADDENRNRLYDHLCARAYSFADMLENLVCNDDSVETLPIVTRALQEFEALGVDHPLHVALGLRNPVQIPPQVPIQAPQRMPSNNNNGYGHSGHNHRERHHRGHRRRRRSHRHRHRNNAHSNNSGNNSNNTGDKGNKNNKNVWSIALIALLVGAGIAAVVGIIIAVCNMKSANSNRLSN